MSAMRSTKDYPIEMRDKMEKLFDEAFTNPCFDCVNYLECGNNNAICDKFEEEVI